MKKRAVSLVGAVILTVFTALFTLSAYAAEKPEIAAQGAALYNASTGEFLFGKNENQQFYPASITKVMTALLVLENGCGEPGCDSGGQDHGARLSVRTAFKVCQ